MRNMTVVISDLHFEEEATDIISDPAGVLDPIVFRRNVPAVAFENMMRDVADQARTNGAARIDLVLAGDIFDLYRTQYWFMNDEGLRPYVDCMEVTPELESKLIAIIDGIVAEKDVARSVAVFRRFAQGTYLERSDSATPAAPFGIPVQLHYLPGNHDRLANATPAIRKHVRDLLGMPGGDAPFPHYILFADPPVLIRHGHEYDRYNFATDLTHEQIGAALPAALYNAPTWGDYNTVAVAARLPFLLRRHFGDGAILKEPVLQIVYCRLLEFDDVRPQSTIVDFFLNTTVPVKLPNQKVRNIAPDAVKPADLFAHRETLQKQMWTKIKPVVFELLDEVIADKYFRQWTWKFFPFYTVLLLLRPWRWIPLPLWLVRMVGRYLKGDSANLAESFAAHEIEVHKNAACFVCAGHTHKPLVAHIFTRNDLKRFYTDTGTWRNAVLAAGDRRSYGRVNATTYVTFYGRQTDPQSAGVPDHGFEYWTGYDQNWPVDDYDH